MEKENTLREGLNEFYKNKNEILEHINIRAEMCREYYLGLLDQGFNENDALELCKYFKF